MASKGIQLYAEKKYELEELTELIKPGMRKGLSAEFVDQVSYELGETKVVLMTFECWFLRTSSYASLSILLTEYGNCQGAYIVSSGGKEVLFSFGAEDRFVREGETVLKDLGFSGK